MDEVEVRARPSRPDTLGGPEAPMTWIRNRPLGLVYRDGEQSQDGYTLFSSVRGRHSMLLDDEGRVVHQWHHEDGIQHLYLIEGGHLLGSSIRQGDGGEGDVGSSLGDARRGERHGGESARRLARLAQLEHH